MGVAAVAICIVGGVVVGSVTEVEDTQKLKVTADTADLDMAEELAVDFDMLVGTAETLVADSDMTGDRTAVSVADFGMTAEVPLAVDTAVADAGTGLVSKSQSDFEQCYTPRRKGPWGRRSRLDLG
ncbi:hypothetical protein BGZ79_002565 [Entomortierella chlamydospora]|nr:hypothetical protein BGZ79_002565 [Entomortierella chlamydospora]